MKRHLTKLRYVLALALLAGASACDSASEITGPVERPSVEGPRYLYQLGVAEGWIGPDGGILNVGESYVWVQPLAVQHPTYFRMRTNGLGIYGIGVSLHAWTAGPELGAAVTTFSADILIDISYSGTGAASLNGRDQQRLFVEGPGGEHLAGGVNIGQKRVWGWTRHFSDFVIARED